jgi:putative transposase
MPDYLTKVIKLEILKPLAWVGGARDGEPCTWKELAKVLRDIQYLSARVANQFISERYAATQLQRLPSSPDFEGRKMAAINKALRESLVTEGNFSESQLNAYSTNGCLPAMVLDALRTNIIDPQITGKNWRDVMAANSAVPSFRRRIPVCFRGDKPKHKKIVRTENDHTLDLSITVGSKIRIVLKTQRLAGSQRAILDKLCEKGSGYTQRSFQISHNERRNKWFLACVFRFPPAARELDKSVIVGADLGYSCPLFAAVSNSEHARLGRRDFDALSQQVKRLQGQTIRRRRLIQNAGRDSFAAETARGGHGRKRRLKPMQRFEDKINNAYKTLNHQISRRLIDFALQHNAGTIQIEDLGGLQQQLTGTFLGERWRYFELQQMIAYKANEHGIDVNPVSAQYTSRRCSACGHINESFTRQYRDSNKPADGGVTPFACPSCGASGVDPDFNAARNLCVADITKKIRAQCKKQGIRVHDEEDS